MYPPVTTSCIANFNYDAFIIHALCIHSFYHPVVPSSGGNGSFRCLPRSVNIMSIQWLMNGSATLINEAIASGNAVVLFDGSLRIGLLHVINIPLEFNETNIQCHGVLTSGSNFTTGSAILLLQGKFSQ